MELSEASIRRVFQRVGGKKIRVSKKARKLMSEAIYEIMKDIASEATNLAFARGQLTVTEEDIRNAISIVFSREVKT